MKKKIIIIAATVIAIVTVIMIKEIFVIKKNKQTTQLIEQKVNIEGINPELNVSLSDEIKKVADIHTDNETSFAAAFFGIVKSGKPLLLSLSYEANCCEGTRRFFNKYNQGILELFTVYKGKAATIFFNAGKINEQQRNDMVQIAQKIKLEKGFPILVLFDKKGVKIKSVINEFNQQEIKTVIEGLLK